MKFRMVLISPPAVDPLEVPELEVPPDVPLEVASVPPPLLVAPLPLPEPWPNRLSRVHSVPLMPLELEPEPPEAEPLDVDPLGSVEVPSHPLPEPPPCFATP